MQEVIAKTAAWLQSVLRRLPAAISAIYIEYSDAVTQARSIRYASMRSGSSR